VQRQTICILGLSGGVGAAVAESLLRKDFNLRALVRDPLALPAKWTRNDAVTLIPGDAMHAADIARAAEGCSAIFHGVNPGGYRDWGKLVLPMIDSTIAAARAVGHARIVLPGTVYNFDPTTTPLLGENSPQEPSTEKGSIRREMERRLEVASAAGSPVLILRAGDFFGAEARSSWFSQAMVRAGCPVRRVINPGKGVGHSWAYLPDLAEAFARLLEASDRLRPFERLQFEGTWDPDGKMMQDAIRRVLGRRVPERSFPWWLIRVLAPFGGFPAAVRDVESYWRHPIRLDNARLQTLLGNEPRTPLDEALKRTLTGLGCLHPITNAAT
jgi:nucleoside-diphosphate-sugar epimerase